MTEQHRTGEQAQQPAERPAGPPEGRPGQQTGALADLEQRPVAEHVAVFEAEHARLQQELSSIDQL